ncbi:MAG: hypothetical protein IJP92_01480, partial [Lachnospiraceae bacterium]|nr:hypothetical protein [Lachnospiraceae bacterium]
QRRHRRGDRQAQEGPQDHEALYRHRRFGAIYTGTWDAYAGQIQNLGLISGTDPEFNYVQLPMETTQWGDGFTQEDYIELVGKIYDGTIKVSNDISVEEPPASTITVNFQGNIQ